MKIIINFNDKTYKSLNNPSGQKITGLNTVQLDKGGICRVVYHEQLKYHNEFEFNDSNDFGEKIKPCIDRQLIKEFK